MSSTAITENQMVPFAPVLPAPENGWRDPFCSVPLASREDAEWLLSVLWLAASDSLAEADSAPARADRIASDVAYSAGFPVLYRAESPSSFGWRDGVHFVDEYGDEHVFHAIRKGGASGVRRLSATRCHDGASVTFLVGPDTRFDLISEARDGAPRR